MLRDIPPLLHPDFLQVLAAMGHGDELAIVDANFPAARHARRLIVATGADVPTVLDAVLQLLPLDTFVEPAAFTMEVVGAPDDVPAPVADFAAVLTRHGLADAEIGRLTRADLLARTRDAFAVVRTGELRAYGNILLVKGVRNELVRAPPESS